MPKKTTNAVSMMDIMISTISVSEDSNVTILANSSNLGVQSPGHLKSDQSSKSECSNAGPVGNLARKSCNSSNTQNPRSVSLKTVIEIRGNYKCPNLSSLISRR